MFADGELAGALSLVSVGRRDTSGMPRPAAGLCDSCVHQRIVRNTRGSSFSLCERSRTDPAYPRYPRLPVTHCQGHEPRRDREAV
jgi:hypothetical protein